MTDTPSLDRLAASDLFLLLWDDYGWSSDIGGLAILDGASLLGRDGRIRIEAVRARLEPRLHLVPRFRQLLYRPRLGLGWPLWADAPTFDLADHIRVCPVAAPGGQAQLLAAWRGKRADSDVVGEIERRSVYPQGPAQAEARPVQQLPEARHQVQFRLEVPPYRVDTDATLVVEQAGAIEDGEPADVGGPAIVVPQQEEQVRSGQPFQQTGAGHDVTPLPALAHACLGTCPAYIRRMILCPKSAVGPNISGQPPSITVMPCCRP